jgi:LytS/YehU family sensor histidine kinase
MLIQPYLENAIIHGFNSFIGNGLITMDVILSEGLIRIKLEDNGIGRVKSKEIQAGMGLKRTSMGMFITAKRVELLKRNKSERFNIKVTDLYDAGGLAKGTRVEIELVPRIINEHS